MMTLKRKRSQATQQLWISQWLDRVNAIPAQMLQLAAAELLEEVVVADRMGMQRTSKVCGLSTTPGRALTNALRRCAVYRSMADGAFTQALAPAVIATVTEHQMIINDLTGILTGLRVAIQCQLPF